MNPRTWLIAGAIAALALTGCATAPKPTTLAQTTAAKPELSTFTKLANEAGITDTLAAPGPYTVFAPTDDAFKTLPPATLAKLGADKALLKSVLSYHVLHSKLVAAEVKNGPVKTLQGANVAVSKSGDFVTVEDAVVTQPDLMATNGVVHVIDRVLMPPTK
jgi:uncharacterized surface protein with fasciclin (FAS1) repeats